MSQENTNFSNKTKALQAILRKRKPRTVPASETELFPLRGEASDMPAPTEVSLFSEEFSKTSGKPLKEDGISEEIINEAFQEAMAAPDGEAESDVIPEEYAKEEPLENIPEISEDPDKEAVQAMFEEAPAEAAEVKKTAEAESVFEDTEKEVFQETLAEPVIEPAIAAPEIIAEEYPKEELPECTEEIAEDPEKEAFQEAAEEEIAAAVMAEPEGIPEEYPKDELPVSCDEVMEDTEKEVFRETSEEEITESMTAEPEVIARDYPKDEPLEVIREIKEDTEKEIFRETAEDEVTEPMTAEPDTTAGEYPKDELMEIIEEIPEDPEKETFQKDAEAAEEVAGTVKELPEEETVNDDPREDLLKGESLAAIAESAMDLLKDGLKKPEILREEIPAGKKTEKDLIREKAEDFCRKVNSSIREAVKEKGIQPGTGIEALYSVGLNSLMQEGLFVRFLKTKNRINWDGESLADYHTVKDDKNYADDLIVSIAECLKELGFDSRFYYMYSDYNRSGDAVKDLGVFEKGHFFNEKAVRDACPKGCMITAAKPGEALLIKSDNQYGYQKTKLLVVVSGAVQEDSGDSPEAGKNEAQSFQTKTNAGAMNRDAQACGKKVVEFTSFCASLLKKNGYENVAVIPTYGCHGIDIIAFRDRVKFGIQCICDAQPVGIPVIRETIAGRNYYGCHVAAVMTDGAIAEDAAELARKNGIVLWDDSVIAKFEKTTYRNCCTEI